MKKGSITNFRLNPKKPPKTDWRAFDAMSEEERHDPLYDLHVILWMTLN
jgi:hypothetical protein